MIYGVKYNIEKNEFYTFEAGDFAELKIACSAPVWFVDEGVRVLIMGVEAESLEEANRIAADKICEYFDGKREEALEEAAKYTLEVSKYEKLERAVKYAEHIVGDKKKIYSVCYFAARAVGKYRKAVDKNAEKIYVVGYDGEEGSLIVELREKASEQPCDRAYQTGDSEYVSYVEAVSKKEALKKGVREIEKLLKKQKKNVERQVEELGDSWEELDSLETGLRKLVAKAEMGEKG